MKDIAYARAYNKLEAFARSLSWDIRLLYRTGEVEIENDGNILRYVTDGRCVSLALDPFTSEVVLYDTGTGERRAYSIEDRYVLDQGVEGIDRAKEEFKRKIRKTELKPISLDLS